MGYPAEIDRRVDLGGIVERTFAIRCLNASHAPLIDDPVNAPDTP